MLYCGESNVAPSKYSIMDNKNHFESKVSDFLEALRKAGYSESTIRQYKKTCRLFIVYMDINYIPVGWIKKLVKWQMKGCAYFWFLVT